MAVQVGQSGEIKADINVTPLIDVVLVLLIIFMVVTPMLQRGEPVQLPQGSDPDQKPDGPDDVILSVKEDENLYLSTDAGMPLTPSLIEERLRLLFERDPNTPLYIKADKRLKYGTVKRAMLICEKAGFKGVSLVAEVEQR